MLAKNNSNHPGALHCPPPTLIQLKPSRAAQFTTNLLLLLLLTACGLFKDNGNKVDQGVAFPQPGEAPPTTQPQPAILSSTTPEPTASAEPSPTTPPTEIPIAPPTQPPLTAAPPQILNFDADLTDTTQGKTITFTWQSGSAASARIYNWANGSTRFPAFWDVSPSGALTVDLTGTRRRDPHFELVVYAGDPGSPSDSRSLQIPWDCSLDYFFQPGSDICPWSPPTYTTAAAQQFQGGRMVWLEELDWIYVLYDEIYPDGEQGSNLQWERYDDNWTEDFANAKRTLQPPPGLYPPAGGFSLIWQENPEVRERLGWAISSETVFNGAWQLQPSDTDYQGDGAIFIQLEDGQVARLSGFDTWGWLWAIAGSVL